jgi:hypothetical protein
LCIEWLCTQERWNPEVIAIFGAAARNRRATVGSSRDYAHSDNSTLHKGKIYFFPLHIGIVFRVPAKNNERRRGHRPMHPRSSTVNQNADAGTNWAKAYVHKNWARIQMNLPVV